MKKVIFSVLSAFCMLSASAQSEFCIKPVHVESDDEATLEFYMDTDFYIQGMQFNVLLPKGVTICKNKQGKIKEGTSYDYDGTIAEADWTPAIAEVAVGEQQQINFVFGATNGTKATAAKGIAFELYVNVDESVEPGVYPVELDCKKFSNGTDRAVIGKYTSYIVVDDGKGAFVPANVLGAVVNEALAADASVTAVDLSGVTAVNGTFTYADSRNVVAPADVTASVKYEGDKAGYYSVNVPFGADVTGEVYEFASASGGYAHFDKVTTVEANKTYLAKGKVTIAANAKVASVAEQTGQTGNYVLDDTFYHGSNLTVPATRGLFEGASLSNLRVVVDGELTGINMAQIEAGEASYDLQGRQTTNTKNGVFVVNGKKQFVK